jgi:hypothetical protein
LKEIAGETIGTRRRLFVLFAILDYRDTNGYRRYRICIDIPSWHDCDVDVEGGFLAAGVREGYGLELPIREGTCQVHRWLETEWYETEFLRTATGRGCTSRRRSVEIVVSFVAFSLLVMTCM